jgi:D-hexose-6-phosphate mutarotase
MTVDELNSKFGIAGALTFGLGQGGFVFAKISTPAAEAEICLYGGQVVSFTPVGEAPVIWLSPDAVYREGKAIRGGIPICWPWFSAHPSDPEKPSHGTARISEWELRGAELLDGGALQLRLSLPGEHGCELALSVSRNLSLALETTNRSDGPLMLSAALHSYFQVGDIADVRLEGLSGVAYLDDVDASVSKVQDGRLVIHEEVDRRYLGTTKDVLIHDSSLGRTVSVSKTGSASTVVWNPWSGRAAELGDMPDDGYQTMVCVEAANVGPDEIALAPGESQVLGTTISVS